MKTVIVPNHVRSAITTILDAAYKLHPDAEPDRDIHYAALLQFFDENGYLPSVELARNAP